MNPNCIVTRLTQIQLIPYVCVCVFLIFNFILYIYIYTTFVHEIGGFKNCKNTTKDLAPRIGFTNLIRLNVLLCI